MFYAIFNPYSNNNKGEESARLLDNCSLDREIKYVNITEIESYEKFFAGLESDDAVILCGGDGTLNRFVNDTLGLDIKHEIYYFGCGTGNDFLHDIAEKPYNHPILINKYLDNLPVVTVKGRNYSFLNNVGFGIDGYCCEVGDDMRAQGKENINYAGIAIKGLLGGFKPVNAEVTIDGQTTVFKKAWLCPTMKGRYYGGGMMPTPGQDRLNPEETLSVMLFYGKGKLKTLMAFPSIFQGEHVKHTDMVKIMTGQDITVKFNRPCALQIDGETIREVTEYHARSRKTFDKE